MVATILAEHELTEINELRVPTMDDLIQTAVEGLSNAYWMFIEGGEIEPGIFETTYFVCICFKDDNGLAFQIEFILAKSTSQPEEVF